jgi:hypothetical protein
MIGHGSSCFEKHPELVAGRRHARNRGGESHAPSTMRMPRHALLLSLALALPSTGCIAIARETYTSLRGQDVTRVAPSDDFEVSPGRIGHALSHDESLGRASWGPSTHVTAAVCDWDAGVWFVVFPPVPIPLLSPGDSLGRPGTTLVRLTLDGQGTWRANLASLALVGENGVRAAPERYELVTRSPDDSLEPCSADVDPDASIESAQLAIFGKAELWLRFPTLDWPDEPRTLELDGLSLAGAPLRKVSLEFEPGARWFWYRVFP